MPVEQTKNETVATKPKGNLFTLTLKRVPSGIELDFESPMLVEYFKATQRGETYALTNWKDKEGNRMAYRNIVYSRLPSEITSEHEWRSADGQLFSSGYATFSWIGCQSFPVVIQGVYTQAQLDKYASVFTALMKNLYLKVLKPYERKVTLTYSLEG